MGFCSLPPDRVKLAVNSKKKQTAGSKWASVIYPLKTSKCAAAVYPLTESNQLNSKKETKGRVKLGQKESSWARVKMGQGDQYGSEQNH